MNPDVSMHIGNTKFNFRVACIVEYDGKILLHKRDTDDFWNLVGGRVKCNEDTLSALKREMEEELNINITDAKLVNVSENFFYYDNQNYHEMLFIYYHKTNDAKLIQKQDFLSLDNEHMTYHWFSKEEIKNIVCKPQIIYSVINQDVNTLTHNIDIQKRD